MNEHEATDRMFRLTGAINKGHTKSTKAVWLKEFKRIAKAADAGTAANTVSQAARGVMAPNWWPDTDLISEWFKRAEGGDPSL